MTGDAVVALEVGDGVAHLRMGQPSVDPRLAADLVDAAVRLQEDPTVKVVVLAGTDRAFSVGGDLGFFAAAEDPGAAIGDLAAQVHTALRILGGLDAPLIASVRGPAAGIGLSLVCAADLVVAGESASFTAAYGAVGLSPDGGQSWTLPRLVGWRRAAEMILTNRRVGAAEAAAIGLVTEVVADAEVDHRAGELAARLAAASRTALGAAKRLLRASATATLDAHLDTEAASIAALADGADGREGVAAFLAKRPPAFG